MQNLPDKPESTIVVQIDLIEEDEVHAIHEDLSLSIPEIFVGVWAFSNDFIYYFSQIIGGKMAEFLAEFKFLLIGDILSLVKEAGSLLFLLLHHFFIIPQILAGRETLRSGK